MLIEQKLRFSEFTSIETQRGLRLSSFSVFKRRFLNDLLAKILVRSYQLDSNYTLEIKDNIIRLQQGKYPIKVIYYENSGTESLNVLMKGPGMEKQSTPPIKLFLY